MHSCPRCRKGLTPFVAYNRSGMRCLLCGSYSLSRSLVEWMCRDEFNKALGDLVRAGRGRARGPCPQCSSPLREIPRRVNRNALRPWEPSGEATSPLTDLELEHCPRCELLWMSEITFRKLPLRAKQDLEEEAEVDSVKTFASVQAEEAPEDPAAGMAAALAGLPFKENVRPLKRTPAATIAIAASLLIGALWTRGDPTLATVLALQPSLFGHGYWFELFTYPWTMSHPAELLFNLYVLLLFGGNAEELLGPAWLAILLLASSAAAGLMHLVFSPGTAVRGAAGLVAGLTAFFSAALPRARVGVNLSLGPFDNWIRFPPFLWLLFWLLSQTLGSLYRFIDTQDMALFGILGEILGGAAAGLAVWAIGIWHRPGR